ncbi:glutaredoxin family protein [Actinomyces naeslundii]
MSEYSIGSPGQTLTVEHLPSGVVYAATEDLPATARQVIEGLQDPGSLGPGVEWRGPGPAAPDVDVAIAWDDQAQAVAYSVRGRPERTVTLDDLNQALAQDWDHYRQDVDAAGQLLERLDAITTPAGLDAEEMEVAFSPTRRTVTAQITVEPDFTPDDVLTQGMRGELMIEETGQGAQLQLEGAPTTGSLTDEHARQLLSHAVGDARRDPGITAWRQVHPRTAAFRDQGLVVEDPIVNRTGSASVLVRTQRAALEPMSIYGEQAVAFSLDGDELVIRAGGSTVQQLRSGELEPAEEDLPWTRMTDAQAAAALLGMPQEEFDAAASSVREGLVAARDAAAPRRPATNIFNDLRTHLIRVDSLLPDAARETASTSFDLDRGVAWVRAQAMDASHRPITIGVPVDSDSPLLEVVDRQTVEPGTVGPWVDPTPLSDAERYEAATPVSAQQARWDIDSAVLRDADEHTAHTWATWRAAGAQGWGAEEASALERWAQAQATLAGGDARATVVETSPGDPLEADATGRLLEIHGNGMDCRVITTSPGQVTVTTPAGTSTMTTAEMMDQVRAAWPDTTTDALNAPTPTRATEREQDASQAQAPELTVYTKPDCPGCRMTKRELDKAGAAYNEIDLTTRPDLVEQFMAEGLRSAPVVELGAERVAGFNPAKIRAIAAQAMSPTPPTAPAPSGAGQPPAPRPSGSRIDQHLQVRGEAR